MTIKSKVKRVSRADVAKVVGVAPCTVSLVLNNTPNTRVRDKVRQRIHEVANELGYRPSATARALVTGRTNSIAIVIFQGGTPFDAYTSEMLGEFWKRIHDEKFRIIVDSIGIKDDAAQFFIDHAADGILLVAPPREIKNLILMQKAEFPLVCVGNIPDCENVDYVDLDNYSASKKITEYLIKQGHRKIVHISGILEYSSTAVERLSGYRDALFGAGIDYDPSNVFHGEFIYDAGRDGIKKFIADKKEFTAVCATCSDTAYGAIDELAAHGISVPSDVSIATVKSINKVGRRRELTGIINPLKEIGKIAGEILSQRIKGLKGSAIEQRLSGEFFIGNTVKKL